MQTAVHMFELAMNEPVLIGGFAYRHIGGGMVAGNVAPKTARFASGLRGTGLDATARTLGGTDMPDTDFINPPQGSGGAQFDIGKPYVPPKQYHDITLHSPELLEEVRRHRELLGAILATLQNIERRLDTMSGTQSQLDAEVQQLQVDVSADTDAINSAITVIGKIQGWIDAAVAAALAAGATPAQLQAITDLSTTLNANDANLAAAIASAPAPGVQAHVRKP